MDNTFYSQENHGPFEHFELGDFKLENGGLLPNCKLAFSTAGKLNTDKDNVILLPHMYSGSSKHMLDVLVGEDLALDPRQYFIILPNQLGNGLSSSPHNTPPPLDGSNFPELTIGDDVRAQYKLVTEHFGIDTLELVLGWSMGAQQTYEWCVRYPDNVKRAAAIAGTAKTTPHDMLYTQVVGEAITSDPAWESGSYADPHAVTAGLKNHARIFALFGASTELYKQAGWSDIGLDSMDNFLSEFWEPWFASMDPNNLLCMLSKWCRGDVSAASDGNLAKALSRITAKVYVIAFEEDMFIPVRDCKAEQELIPGSELIVLPSLWGHFTPLVPIPGNRDPLNKALEELLSSVELPVAL